MRLYQLSRQVEWSEFLAHRRKVERRLDRIAALCGATAGAVLGIMFSILLGWLYL